MSVLLGPSNQGEWCR